MQIDSGTFMVNSLLILILSFIFNFIPIYSEPIKFNIETNVKKYRPNQSIRFKIKSESECYLYLIAYQSDGSIQLLFPNPDDNENKLRKGEFILPGQGKDYEFLTGEKPGTDTLFAIASLKKINKLHKDKFYKEPIYKTVKENKIIRKLKKLTKDLSPEEWVLEEIKINIK